MVSSKSGFTSRFTSCKLHSSLFEYSDEAAILFVSRLQGLGFSFDWEVGCIKEDFPALFRPKLALAGCFADFLCLNIVAIINFKFKRNLWG